MKNWLFNECLVEYDTKLLLFNDYSLVNKYYDIEKSIQSFIPP